MDFSELSKELLELFGRGVRVPVSDDRFNDIALKVFEFQFRESSIYRAFALRRGAEPGGLGSWGEIPAVPARAFKSVPLVAGSLNAVERVFRTSGTTGGKGRRGEHHVLDLDLYRGSLLPNFQAALIPDGAKLRFLCLLPAPHEKSDSSLSFMMGVVAEAFGAPGSGFFLDASGAIDLDALVGALGESVNLGQPVLLAGTAFGFVHLLDLLAAKGRRFELPVGSRLLETGGYKGRSRVLPREDLYRGLEEAFGIPLGFMVNEYGMTELLSQFYEPVLLDRFGGDLGTVERGLEHRYHRPPPWVRSRSLDPSTLRPVEPGEVGVLFHVDLANLGSVIAVLTEDLGREVEGGFQLVGRTPGAEPRGCSLATEEFLESVGGAHDGV